MNTATLNGATLDGLGSVLFAAPAVPLPTWLGLTFEPIDAYAGLDLDMSTFEDLTW